MNDLTFVMWGVGVPLAIFLFYLTIRLGAAAYYRSRKEFVIWYKTHMGKENEEEMKS